MNPQIIAFYLPQFHRTKENDEWWGKGFTEWTNVAMAKPLFRGHYQPKIPTELGFYDLRFSENREAQAILAQKAGISAFCYWHYWFGNGKKLLNMPFEEVVRLKKPDMPFCLAWANHSWYKKSWKTNKSNFELPRGSKLLVEQTYPGIEDIDAHFYYLLDAFRDKRYYKIDGRLLFVIYAPLKMIDWQLFRDRWQELAQKEGLSGFYFVGHTMEQEFIEDIKNMGYDAVNFSTHHQAFPHKEPAKGILHYLTALKNSISLKPKVVEYEKAIESFQQAIEAAGSLDSSCRLDVVGYRAEAKMKLGDYEGSLEDYNELIEAGYRLRDIYQLTGNVYLLMDDVDQALHCYQKCLDIDNRNYEGYLTMADALKKAEAQDARQVVLNAALEVIPYEAKDWCYRGRIYLELEQTDEAFSAFEESYNKGYAQAGYYLGYCYELQGKSEEAINLYQEQIKHDPQDAGLYNQLSSCLVRQGEYQDALIMIQKGMQLADESQMADFLWNERDNQHLRRISKFL